MTPVTYVVANEKTSPKFGNAFAQGCRGPIEYRDKLHPNAPAALFGSPQRWQLLQEAFRQAIPTYYGDHAYMGRGQFYRVTRDAYQHDGRGEATPDRFEALGRPVQPWRKTGHHVLICPNSPTYFGLFGMDVHQWVADVTRHIAAATNRPVRVRWKGQDTPIQADLVNCWAVVVFSSASAVDALIAGVPVFTLADFGATRRMGSADLSQIEYPKMPEDREPFLWNLAAQQWTLDEIRNGTAWKALHAN
jgi:hypothetical protein